MAWKILWCWHLIYGLSRREVYQMKISTTRAESFSDGVIAIIITIMVLQLFPEIKRDMTGTEVLSAIHLRVPALIIYVLSFVMIGIFWVNHHHMFHLLERTDEVLLMLNLFFLFWISIIPIATAIFGANPFLPTTVAIYGAVMLMTTLSFTVMRLHVSRKKLTHKDEDERLTKKIIKVSLKARTKSILGTLAYLLSIPLAFVSVYASYAFFVIPMAIFMIPDGVDDEKLAEKIADQR